MPLPVKVCFVSLYAYHFFHPEKATRFGGAELQLYNLATELVKDNRFSISFVVGDFGQPDQETILGVQLYKFFNPWGKRRFLRAPFYLRAFRAIFRLIRLLKKIDADIYIQRAASFETGLVALFAKAARKKFIFMTAHDLDAERRAQYGMHWLRWAVFKLGLRLAHLIVSQHEDQKQALLARYRRPSVIRSSAHHIPPPTQGTDKKTILWVARCDDWKQPELFVELARRFPHENFIMVAQESNFPQLFEIIKKEAATLPNLRHLDYVPYTEIDAYFAKAKIFVNTSKSEGFPNTFIQAMKWKTPIVSLNVDPGHIIEQYRLGFVAHNNFEALAHSLQVLLEDQKLWNEMAENGYRYAQEHHDIKKIIDHDKKLLLQLKM